MAAVVNLRKGQRVELAKGVSKFRIELTWTPSRKAESYDLDIMAIELDDEAVLANNDGRYLVFYNNLKDPEQALVHSGDDRTGDGDGEEMKLDLTKVNSNVCEIMFILNIFESQKNHQNFGEIRNIVLKIYEDDSDIASMIYKLEEEESHRTATVLKICSLYRRENIWKLKTINEGVTSTLTKVLTNYGLDSNDNSI